MIADKIEIKRNTTFSIKLSLILEFNKQIEIRNLPRIFVFSFNVVVL